MDDTYILGLENRTPLSLSTRARRQHISLIGATGTGKSTLLFNMMRDDQKNNRGFALLDPHGDLALAAADATPKSRMKDTIYFDPLDTHVVSYNPLTDISPLHRGTIAAHVVSSFKHIWLNTWGARLEYILTNSIRLLLDNHGCIVWITDWYRAYGIIAIVPCPCAYLSSLFLPSALGREAREGHRER